MDNEKLPAAEFVVNNPEQLVGFYEDVLGWRALAQDPVTGSWQIYAHPNDEAEQSIPIVKKVITKATSLLYNFWVDDLDDTTSRVIANGGKIYRETEEDGDDILHIPGIGRQRFFCDPEGNMFGTIERLKGME